MADGFLELKYLLAVPVTGRHDVRELIRRPEAFAGNDGDGRERVRLLLDARWFLDGHPGTYGCEIPSHIDSFLRLS